MINGFSPGALVRAQAQLCPDIPIGLLLALRFSIPESTPLVEALALWARGVGRLMLEHPAKTTGT